MTGSNLKTPREVEALELGLDRARSRTMGSLEDDRGRLSSAEEYEHEHSAMSPRGAARTTQDALTFLKLVRETFKDDDSKYKELLQILKDFQTKSICTAKLVEQVKTLFEAHPRLLTGMNEFLPMGFKIYDPVENSHSSMEEGVDGSHLYAGGQQQPEQVSMGQEEVEETLLPYPAVTPGISSRSPRSSFPFGAAAAAVSPAALDRALDGHHLELQRALGFVNKVKVRFHEERHRFHGFLEVLNRYREAGMATRELVSTVSALFQGHVDLMQDFYGFLPPSVRPPVLILRFPGSKPTSSHTQGRSSPSRHSRGVAPQGRGQSKKVSDGAASKGAGSPTVTEDCVGLEEVLEDGTANHSTSGQMKRHLREMENDTEVRHRYGSKPEPLLHVSKKRRTSVGDQEHNDSGREAWPEEAMDQSSSGNASQRVVSAATLEKKPPCNKCQECLRRRGNATAGPGGWTDGEGSAETERRGSPCSLPENQQEQQQQSEELNEDCYSPRVSLEATAERGIDTGERKNSQLMPKPSRRQVGAIKGAEEPGLPNASQTPPLSPAFSPSRGKMHKSANGEGERTDAAGRSLSEQNHRSPKVRKHQQQQKPGGKGIIKDESDHGDKADGKLELEVEHLNLLTSRKLRRSSPPKITKGKGDVPNGSSPRHLSERVELAKTLDQVEGDNAAKGFSLKRDHGSDGEDGSSPISRNTDSEESAREKLVYFRPKIGKREQKEKGDKSYAEAGGNNSTNDGTELGRTVSRSRAESAAAQSLSPPPEEKRPRRSPKKKSKHLEKSPVCKPRRLPHKENDSPKRKRRRRFAAEDQGDDDNDTAHQSASDESEKENLEQPTLEADDPSLKVPQKRSSARLAHELLRRQALTTERAGQGGSPGVPASARLSEEDQKRMMLQQLEEKKIMELHLKQRKALEEIKLIIERGYSSSALLPKCLRDFSEQVLSCPDLQTIVTQFQEDQELEYSQCKKATVSYYLLPESYIKPLATGRTKSDQEVLNDEWVSAGYDSDGKENSQDESGGGRKQIGREGTGRRAPHDKRLYHEERLFLCEDDQFELDLLRHTAASTIKRLQEIMAKTLEPDFSLESFKLNENLTPLHLRCIERVYGDYGADLIELLRKTPMVALPVILGRLKQKEEVDWPDYQKEMNKTWAEVRAEHFYKALRYSPNGKQSDKAQQCSEEFLNDSHCDGDADEERCGKLPAAEERETKKHPDAEIVYNIVKFLLKDMCMSEEQFNVFHSLWTAHVGTGESGPEEGGAGAAVSKIDGG